MPAGRAREWHAILFFLRAPVHVPSMRRQKGVECPPELRARVVDDYVRGGATYRELAAKHGCSATAVARFVAHYHATGGISKPRARGGARSRPHAESPLRELVLAHRAETLVAIQELARACGHAVSVSTLSRIRRRLAPPAPLVHEPQRI
jgi:transposase